MYTVLSRSKSAHQSYKVGTLLQLTNEEAEAQGHIAVKQQT